jgi:hypothetical protein
LSYTQPRIARNLLRFRHSMLGRARERAAEMSQRGALFPWRTINGEEASSNFQQGTAQYHINADIAYAIRRHSNVQGNLHLLGEIGAEILVETARLWQDLGFYGTDKRFHIHGVTGPDEYTTVVNDNTYTNLMARLNLNFAAATVRRLREERPGDYTALVHAVRLHFKEVESWERAAAAMYIPFDEKRSIHPQDETFLDREAWDLDATPREKFPLLLHYHPLVIYRHQVLKQADIVLAMFLLGNEFSEEQKRRNFDYYDPLTTGAGHEAGRGHLHRAHLAGHQRGTGPAGPGPGQDCRPGQRPGRVHRQRAAGALPQPRGAAAGNRAGHPRGHRTRRPRWGSACRWGPLTLLDLIGLDTSLAVLGVFQAEFGGTRYAPAPLLRQLCDARLFGRKTGRGFYDYRHSTPAAATADHDLAPVPAEVALIRDSGGVLDELASQITAAGISVVP